MPVPSWLTRWFERAPPLAACLAVDFDAVEVRVRVLRDMEPGWNQTFRWSDVRRVCFKDEGLASSDMLLFQLTDPNSIVQVPVEAANAQKLVEELLARGLFQEEAWRRAMGDTSGGMHCWPPHV